MKKLVIIGNSDVKNDCSDFVNSCDVVIRFNACRNYSINTGESTDIVCLTNWGAPARKFSTKKILKKLPAIDKAMLIWFARPRRAAFENIFYYCINKERIDYGHRIIRENGLGGKGVIYFSRSFYGDVWKKLLQMGPTRAVMPSTGILAIEKVLVDEEFREFEKYIIGFVFEGWKGHPWDLEQQLVNNYLSQGLLKSL